MKEDKEKWIENILGMTGRIKPVESNSFLIEKIFHRLNDGFIETRIYRKKIILQYSLGLVFLLIVNLASLRKFDSHRNIYHEKNLFGEYAIFNNYNY